MPGWTDFGNAEFLSEETPAKTCRSISFPNPENNLLKVSFQREFYTRNLQNL
ncbi:MAG: hypothetical protein PWQ29_251 [Verrucomicrobiota bacterium]|jgi:hypothetical protein|nr:hypothetical protein [Verrucomicrobiota bacterium]